MADMVKKICSDWPFTGLFRESRQDYAVSMRSALWTRMVCGKHHKSGVDRALADVICNGVE